MSMPRYAQNAIQGQGQGGLGGMFGGGFGGGLENLLGGMFGNSGSPYGDAMKQFQKYMQQATGAQNPFYNAGSSAIGPYQDWLKKMSDPTAFMNNTMNQYQQSPYAKYEQQQAMRSANNIGSASGMTGSTPLMQQAQQNATNISGQDMNSWLQNVLGINQQYGAGEAGMMGMGQHAADQLSGLYSQMGQGMSGLAYGQGAANNTDRQNMLMGFLQMLGL